MKEQWQYAFTGCMCMIVMFLIVAGLYILWDVGECPPCERGAAMTSGQYQCIEVKHKLNRK